MEKFELLSKMDISYKESLGLPNDLTFGIEIEYENVLKNDVSRILDKLKEDDSSFLDWRNKSESDIAYVTEFRQEFNGEINSPILKDSITTWKNLKTILEEIKNKGAIVTNYCGGHINIGAHILEDNPEYLRNLFLIWILYEKEIVSFSSGEFNKIRDRKEYLTSSYSTYLKNNMDLVLDIKDKTMGSYIKDIDFMLFSKNYAIALPLLINKKMRYDNRIEFRLPNGSLSEEIWQNYINFYANLVLICKKDLDVEKILYKIYKGDHNLFDLANLVFSSEEDKNNFLIQSLGINKKYNKELVKHLHY